MDFSKLLSTLPFLAPFAAIFMFWSSIQSALHKIFNLFVVEMDLQSGSSEALCHFLLKNAKQISFGFNSYVGNREYLKPLKKNAIYAMRKTQGQASLFYYQGRFLYMSPNNGTDKQTNEHHDRRIKLYFIRGTFNPDSLVEKAVDEYNNFYSKYSARFCVNLITGMGNKSVIGDEAYRGMLAGSYGGPNETNEYYYNKIIKYKIEDIGYGSADKKKIPYVFNRDSNIILDDVKKWKESEAWYRDRGILFRRGTLLYSKPGAGKSSGIRATAQMLDLPLYIYDLASLSNLELVNSWKEMLSATPCVAVFEDIDAVFHGRKNVIGESGGGLSFDCLLNVIGGTLPAEGVYTFVTTNHVEKLDPALGVPDKNGNSSRPGRLDNMMEMNYLSHDCKTKIANRILDGTDIDKDELINIKEDITAARFVELCGQKALKHHWKKF